MALNFDLQIIVGDFIGGFQQRVSAACVDDQVDALGGKRWQKTSVSRVINSHGGLKHIPAMPVVHEAAVSGGEQA